MTKRRLTFAPRAGILRKLREEVRRLAHEFGAAEKVGDNLALVVDEIVNNAIEHGSSYRNRGLDLAVQIVADGDRLRIEFFDPETPNEVVTELDLLPEARRRRQLLSALLIQPSYNRDSHTDP